MSSENPHINEKSPSESHAEVIVRMFPSDANPAGNVFGGESLLHSMFYLVPQLKWILPVPFYFMEVLIGLVQALVFMLLISVYIGLICNHDEGEKH